MSDGISAKKNIKHSGGRGADSSNKAAMRDGMRDGLPIALGYLSVGFTLGIVAKNAGLTAFQGFLTSILNNASAGEYAGFVLMAAGAPYLELAIMMLITNARYMLMSCALSQKFAPETPMYQRILVGFDITDELFGIAIARPGYLNPFYSYGAFIVTIPCWSIGTALGVLVGNVLPLRAMSALSVALYGMFICAFIPEAKKNKIVAGLVGISFLLSYVFSRAALTAGLSEGMRTIILTILIAGMAAVLFPVPAEDETDDGHVSRPVKKGEPEHAA